MSENVKKKDLILNMQSQYNSKYVKSVMEGSTTAWEYYNDGSLL